MCSLDYTNINLKNDKTSILKNVKNNVDSLLNISFKLKNDKDFYITLC